MIRTHTHTHTPKGIAWKKSRKIKRSVVGNSMCKYLIVRVMEVEVEGRG